MDGGFDRGEVLSVVADFEFADHDTLAVRSGRDRTDLQRRADFIVDVDWPRIPDRHRLAAYQTVDEHSLLVQEAHPNGQHAVAVYDPAAPRGLSRIFLVGMRLTVSVPQRAEQQIFLPDPARPAR